MSNQPSLLSRLLNWNKKSAPETVDAEQYAEAFGQFKKLPLRLVSFLDRMTDQHIFEDNRRTLKGKKQRGATWRFRHKILQDYFANLADNSTYGSKP